MMMDAAELLAAQRAARRAPAAAALPPRPFPSHVAGVEVMLAATWQRMHAVRTSHLVPASFNQYERVGKLTKHQRKQIIEIGYDQTAAQIGKRFGVSERTVQAIRAQAGLSHPQHPGHNQHKKGKRNE